MNNQWSVAGWGQKNVNAFLLQPFVNYNLPDGWYLTSVPIMTANWKADKAGDVWTVPLGGGVGKLFKIDKLPIDTQLQAFGNVAKPQYGADWQLRFQIKLLFPSRIHTVEIAPEPGTHHAEPIPGRITKILNQLTE